MNVQEKYSQATVVEFWTRFAGGGLQAAEAAMLDRYAPGPPARVLDLGCGAGRVTLALEPRGYRVTGLDITGPLLQAARSAVAREGFCADFTLADLCDPPCAADTFELAVVLIAALQHVAGRARRQAALGQIARVLKTDGVLIVALDNVAPALQCYAAWALQKAGLARSSSSPAAKDGSPADAILASNRSRTSGLRWHARGLARTLRWRAWEGIRDAARRLRLVRGESGDTMIQQVSMPATSGSVYYHLYGHEELLADAEVAGFALLGYHSGRELAGQRPFSEKVRRLDKQVLYAFRKASSATARLRA